MLLLCDSYNKGYKSRAGLHDHIRLNYQDRSRYECGTCFHKFMSKSSYLVCVNVKLYKCAKCQKGQKQRAFITNILSFYIIDHVFVTFCIVVIFFFFSKIKPSIYWSSLVFHFIVVKFKWSSMVLGRFLFSKYPFIYY